MNEEEKELIPSPEESAEFSAEEAPAEDMTVPEEADIPADAEFSDDGEILSTPEEESAAPLSEEPVEVIGVRFKKQGKIYYFDPVGVKAEKDDHVIVETSRGQEYGVVALGNRMVSGRDVVPPLRKTVRLATPADDAHYQENLKKETDAYNVCLEQIELHQLVMKLVDVEYTFDNSKLLFYYTADGRVDFRELVKHLASTFRTRIEMRQIGIRDEAKMMGGLGVCGRPFCCASFLSDFVQVSIKMAKEQNLSLNSAKISGACGRLMCCLRYEYETYQAESAITPKVDSVVDTPEGQGIVVEANPLCGLCKVAMLGAFGQQPKTFVRDDLKPTGQMKRDLPPEVLHPVNENDDNKRPERRPLRPRPENRPQRAKSFEEAEAIREEAEAMREAAKAERITGEKKPAPAEAEPTEAPAAQNVQDAGQNGQNAAQSTDGANGDGRRNDPRRQRGGRHRPHGGHRPDGKPGEQRTDENGKEKRSGEQRAEGKPGPRQDGAPGRRPDRRPDRRPEKKKDPKSEN